MSSRHAPAEASFQKGTQHLRADANPGLAWRKKLQRGSRGFRAEPRRSPQRASILQNFVGFLSGGGERRAQRAGQRRREADEPIGASAARSENRLREQAAGTESRRRSAVIGFDTNLKRQVAAAGARKEAKSLRAASPQDSRASARRLKVTFCSAGL